MFKIVIEHRHYVCSPNEDEILSLLREIIRRQEDMATDLSRITNEVSEMSSVVDSAVALLGELAQMIRDNATDPAALNALADTLDSKGTELGEAVAAATPAEEPQP